MASPYHDNHDNYDNYACHDVSKLLLQLTGAQSERFLFVPPQTLKFAMQSCKTMSYGVI